MKPGPIFLLFLLLSMAAVAPSAAQDTPLIVESGGRPAVRPDGTYFFNHAPNSQLVVEAQIAPRIIVADTIGRATQKTLGNGHHAVWAVQASVTPMLRLRSFRESSSPIRSPSYMPKGNIQFVRLKDLSRAEDSGTTRSRRGRAEMWLIDVIPFGHHSNGENGCPFVSQTRDATGECVGAGSPITVNKVDGDFSTNYFEATIHYGRMVLDSVGVPNGDSAARWEWRVGGGLQRHPTGYAPGAIKGELARVYGQTRMLLETTVARRSLGRCGRLELGGKVQYIHGVPAPIPAWGTHFEATCLPHTWGGTGGFVRFYRGQDYYNLWFAERITRLQFGFTLQRAPFLGIRTH